MLGEFVTSSEFAQPVSYGNIVLRNGRSRSLPGVFKSQMLLWGFHTNAKGETRFASLLVCYQSISINASAYWAPVAAVPLDLTSTVHSAMACSSFSAASVRQMWRRSMAAALMMEAGLA